MINLPIIPANSAVTTQQKVEQKRVDAITPVGDATENRSYKPFAKPLADRRKNRDRRKQEREENAFNSRTGKDRRRAAKAKHPSIDIRA